MREWFPPRRWKRGGGWSVTLLALLWASGSFASCGSAFCVLDTNWSTQGVANEPGTARLDLRYEFVDQKHLRSGRRQISAAEDDADATELRTLNRNLLASFDYAFSSNWSLSASVAVADRSHSHIADPAGEANRETWNFARAGDARILGIYRFDSEASGPTSHGLTLGLKLPTGDYRVANSEGAVAERALQPGTGSTDVIIGGYYSGPGMEPDSSWWIQGFVQSAAATKDAYRPGDQFQVNVGYRHPFGDSLQGLLQLNSLIKGRDSGANAEPERSGSRTVFLSPGLSYAFSRDVQAYGFVQIPVYRYVNGAQLSADWAVVAGVTMRF